MNSCGFGAPTDGPWPHEIKDGVRTPPKPDFFGDNPISISPAGGVHCNLIDWSKFAKIHMDGFNGEGSFLKKETFQFLQTTPEGQESTYGPG